MDWQTPVSLLFVLLAGGMVFRWLWRMVRGAGARCGAGCGSCPSNKTNIKDFPLVTLQGLPSDKKARVDFKQPG
ncbi:hypothetical protein SH661x_001270 [Planctomicrobium sp. SH661]|uniref:hypothetical protein n=1 Tax=Planctomicrobium sp. SH661 TaxID=3448124 RepID=UPI003F5C3083